MAAVNNFYAEDNTIRDHTGDSAWTATETTDGIGKIAGSNLAANTKYLLIAKALMGGDNINGNFGLRITTADDATIATLSAQLIEPQHSAITQLYRYFFVRSFTTDASPADIQWEQRTVNAGETARADQMSMIVIDLDDLGSGNYIEASDDSSSELAVAPSWTDLATISTLNASKTYAVYGYLKAALTGGGAYSWQAQLHDGSTAYTYHYREAEDVSDLDTAMACGYADGAVSTTIKVRANEENTLLNANGAGSYLIAIDTAAFANFDYNYVTPSVAIASTNSASPTTLRTLAFTRATSGPHLLVASVRANTAARIGVDMTYGGTEVLANDILVTQTQAWDSVSFTQMGLMARETITSDANLLLRGWYVSGDAAPTAQFEYLSVLDLELSGAEAVNRTNIKFVAVS